MWLPRVRTAVTAEMQALWGRLERWATRQVGLSLRLRQGAQESEVAATEQRLGRRLPEDFRASLLLHDGQHGDGDGDGVFPWMPGCGPLASLARIEQAYRNERKWDDEDAPGVCAHDARLMGFVRHPGRVPIAGNRWWDGDNSYLDFAPGPAGRPGQLVCFVSESDLAVLGESFSDALEAYTSALERGDWVWSDELSGPAPKDRIGGTFPHLAGEFARLRGVG